MRTYFESGKGIVEAQLKHKPARIMKHLSAMNVVEEEAADEYKSTPLSDAMVNPKYRDGVSYMFVDPL